MSAHEWQRGVALAAARRLRLFSSGPPCTGISVQQSCLSAVSSRRTSRPLEARYRKKSLVFPRTSSRKPRASRQEVRRSCALTSPGSSSGVVPLRCPGRGVGLQLLLGCCLRYTGPAGAERNRAEPSGSGSTRPGHERGRMMRRRPRRCSRRPRGAAALGDPARASGHITKDSMRLTVLKKRHKCSHDA